MKPVVVSEVLAVGEFPTSEQIEILAKAGFKSLLHNQPDGEVARFPAAADVESQARRHGLAFAYAPLSSRTPPPEELARYESAVKSLPSPIYAFCYSGSRAAAACALLLTERFEVQALIAQFGEAGFDIEGLRPWLEEERARRTGAEAEATAAAASSAIAPSSSAADSASGSGQTADMVAVAGPDAGQSAPVATTDTLRTLAPPVDVPRTVVIMPRAAGYGGFAI
ncbi:MAG: sulfur transferase domain-containing protein [Hyphomicrobiaceae bacterium]|nr:sulfur transferase domain-containing protein [Hyphomicrobiaceae bacterium]